MDTNRRTNFVAIHNKNGQGLLLELNRKLSAQTRQSQSTIKMDKGYYYDEVVVDNSTAAVAIHNKNGQGLLPAALPWRGCPMKRRNPQ